MFSFFKLADHQARATYLSHLPAAITPNKMEGLLEVEADCNIDEIVLMKVKDIPQVMCLHNEGPMFTLCYPHIGHYDFM